MLSSENFTRHAVLVTWEGPPTGLRGRPSSVSDMVFSNHFGETLWVAFPSGAIRLSLGLS